MIPAERTARRRPAGLLAILLAAFVAAPASVLAAPAVVQAVRFSTAAGHTRLVVELSAPAAVSHQALKDPARVVLDVSAEPGPDLQPLTIDDALVSRVRVGATPGGQARLVLDLKSSVDYRILEVPADGTRPHRIVLDLFAMAPRGKTPAGAEKPGDPAATAPPAERRGRSKPWVVVVDAGHGGVDPGAIGFNLREKDVSLAIARRLVRELNARPGLQAWLSRDDDSFLPLRQRIQAAEKRDADLFISVHANASRDRSARGTEVYFLSLSGATDEAAHELANLENAADLVGGVAPEADDDLSSILFDMQQTDVLQRSSLLAESVVEALRTDQDLLTRGVKQAGFVVLKSPRIPSILVETAFISNAAESRLLRSDSFRVAFARRVASGVTNYLANISVAELR